MLNVILMILKAIGIILAILVGILLLMTAMILWVPVRYRILASKQEEIEEIYAKVNISWLFRFAHVVIRYKDAKLLILISILGFVIYDSRKPKKEKITKIKKTKVNKIKVKKKKEIKDKSNKNIVKETTKSIREIQVKETIESNSEIQVKEVKEILSSEVSQEESKEVLVAVRKGMKYRIKQIINTIRSFPSKLRNFFRLWKKRFHQAKLFINKAISYPKKLKDFLLEEENKAGFAIIIETIKDLLKHIKPKKVEGELIFGLDDPCTTGQVLGAISIIYAYIAPKRFFVIPDFETARLEGSIFARGRIRTFTVLRIAIRLLRDEHFKALKEKIEKFKEE